MAQPAAAAGREELPSPAEETFNKMAERLLNETPEAEIDDEEEEGELEASPDSEEDLVIEEEGEAPVEEGTQPPVSLTKEEKEQFKALPEEAKKFTARRINELERAFQAKSNEVANVQEAARMEYLRYAQGLQQDTAARLNQYAEQLKPRVPDARLARTDPAAYAHMLSEYHEKSAQREQALREADQANQQYQAYQAEIAQRHAQTQQLRLQAEMPELFDPVHGQEHVKALIATAETLGIDQSIINDVDAVKALKLTAEWRSKAEKYDRAMAKKSERVPTSNKPMPTAKPGPPKGTQSKGRSVDAAWKLVKESRAGADRDAATAIWLERAGII